MTTKNIFAIVVFVFHVSVHAQIDTNLYQTATSQNVTTWLKNLTLSPGSGHISFLQGMGSMLIGMNSRVYVDNNNMSAYYSNAPMLNADLFNAGKTLRREFRNMQRAGAYMARTPVLMPWGVIEPSPGNFHYEFIDSTAKISGQYGIHILGTICPFADWTQACNPVIPGCQLFLQDDFFFLNNNKAGAVCDTLKYYNFIQQLVERYDGDGLYDMPGLSIPIKYWEFGNEPDGNCSTYYPGGVMGYVRDLKITTRAMKLACPTCTMLNGGQGLYDSSVPPSGLTFWNTIIDSGYSYINLANVHSNSGKTMSPFRFNKLLKRHLDIFRNKSNQYNLNWTTWVTEWGIYSHAPQSLPYRSEEALASLYTKIYCWSLGNKVTNYFYDLNGDTVSGIGTSALIERIGSPPKSYARLFFYTQKLYEYKFRTYDSVKVLLFDTTTNFTIGDIRFYKAGKMYYVQWGLVSPPPGLTGIKTITDIYGNIQTTNVSNVYPIGSKPLIIEDTTGTTAINSTTRDDFGLRLFPNPFSNETTVTTNQYLTGATVTIYDIIGQEVKRLKNISGHIITIARGDLPGGLYFMRLTQDDKTISIEKLIITEF